MTAPLAARIGMASSLAFHILFAMAGMSLPVLVFLAELRAYRDQDSVAKDLARRWSKGLAVLFAVGAVSGTVLSFELGLLWPEFMRLAGPATGILFAMEGFAFFLEAIFLGIYLYGDQRVGPKMRLASAFGVALCGNASAIFIVLVNGWMNDPVGAKLLESGALTVDPLVLLTNPTGWAQAVHMILAASVSIPLLVLGIHARELLSRPESARDQRAVQIAFAAVWIPTLLLPVSGHRLAELAAERQPTKLAAFEAHWETQTRAPLYLGGYPDEAAEVTRYAIPLPGMLSLLAKGSLDAEVQGLKATPKAERPPVLPVHLSFQLMVGIGTLLLVLVSAGLWLRSRSEAGLWHPLFLKALVLAAPLGCLATEAGWMVTEIGRQPWVVHGYLKTEAAAVQMGSAELTVRALLFLAIYAVLGFTVLQFLSSYLRESRKSEIA